jgi:flagellar biosynthetic protein FliQ
MNIEDVSAIISDAIRIVLVVSLPSVGLGLLAGLAVAIFQAVTQIQEQTLSFVPKMIVVLLIIAVTFPWMMQTMVNLALSLWTNIPLYSQ